MDTAITKNEALSKLQRTLTLNIQGVEEVINFPTAGQLIDIEANKQIYSSKQYGTLVTARIVSTQVAVDIIEMASVFSVVIKDFNKKVKGVDSIFDLDLISLAELVKEYKTKFVPWYSEWLSTFLEATKADEPQNK